MLPVNSCVPCRNYGWRTLCRRLLSESIHQKVDQLMVLLVAARNYVTQVVLCCLRRAREG